MHHRLAPVLRGADTLPAPNTEVEPGANTDVEPGAKTDVEPGVNVGVATGDGYGAVADADAATPLVGVDGSALLRVLTKAAPVPVEAALLVTAPGNGGR